MSLEKWIKIHVIKAAHYLSENKLTSLMNIKILSTLTVSDMFSWYVLRVLISAVF